MNRGSIVQGQRLGVDQVLDLLGLYGGGGGGGGLAVNTVHTFIDKITGAITTLLTKNGGGGGSAKQAAGGIFTVTNAYLLIQDIISQKLETLKTTKKITSEKYAERIGIFKDAKFLAALNQAIPTRTKIEDTAVETGYSQWFNTIFSIIFEGDWREGRLATIGNQAQCIRSLGLPPGTDVPNLQAEGNTICYICGKNTKGENLYTMECEHILPIMSALSHFWLVKKNRIDLPADLTRFLGLEYDWSHACCNRVKSNVDFIIKQTGRPTFIPNEPEIAKVLQQVKVYGKQNCTALPDRESIDIRARVAAIITEKINPLLSVINENIKSFNSDYGLYEVFTKLKLLAALSDEDFISSLSSETKAVQIPKTSAEKAQETRALNKNKEVLLKILNGHIANLTSRRRTVARDKSDAAKGEVVFIDATLKTLSEYIGIVGHKSTDIAVFEKIQDEAETFIEGVVTPWYKTMKGGGYEDDTWEIPESFLNTITSFLSNGGVTDYHAIIPSNDPGQISLLMVTYIQTNPAFFIPMDESFLEQLAQFIIDGVESGRYFSSPEYEEYKRSFLMNYNSSTSSEQPMPMVSVTSGGAKRTRRNKRKANKLRRKYTRRH